MINIKNTKKNKEIFFYLIIFFLSFVFLYFLSYKYLKPKIPYINEIPINYTSLHKFYVKIDPLNKYNDQVAINKFIFCSKNITLKNETDPYLMKFCSSTDMITTDREKIKDQISEILAYQIENIQSKIKFGLENPELKNKEQEVFYHSYYDYVYNVQTNSLNFVRLEMLQNYLIDYLRYKNRCTNSKVDFIKSSFINLSPFQPIFIYKISGLYHYRSGEINENVENVNKSIEKEVINCVNQIIESKKEVISEYVQTFFQNQVDKALTIEEGYAENKKKLKEMNLDKDNEKIHVKNLEKWIDNINKFNLDSLKKVKTDPKNWMGISHQLIGELSQNTGVSKKINIYMVLLIFSFISSIGICLLIHLFNKFKN